MTDLSPPSLVVRHRQEVVAAGRAAKQKLFAEARRLYAAGRKAGEIVQKTVVKRRRVDYWIRHTESPERHPCEPRLNSLVYFRDYLAQRWQDGCHHGRTLLKEIRARGYQGGFSGLARFLSERRPLRQQKQNPQWFP